MSDNNPPSDGEGNEKKQNDDLRYARRSPVQEIESSTSESQSEYRSLSPEDVDMHPVESQSGSHSLSNEDVELHLAESQSGSHSLSNEDVELHPADLQPASHPRSPADVELHQSVSQTESFPRSPESKKAKLSESLTGSPRSPDAVLEEMHISDSQTESQFCSLEEMPSSELRSESQPFQESYSSQPELLNPEFRELQDGTTQCENSPRRRFKRDRPDEKAQTQTCENRDKPVTVKLNPNQEQAQPYQSTSWSRVIEVYDDTLEPLPYLRADTPPADERPPSRQLQNEPLSPKRKKSRGPLTLHQLARLTVPLLVGILIVAAFLILIIALCCIYHRCILWYCSLLYAAIAALIIILCFALGHNLRRIKEIKAMQQHELKVLSPGHSSSALSLLPASPLRQRIVTSEFEPLSLQLFLDEGSVEDEETARTSGTASQVQSSNLTAPATQSGAETYDPVTGERRTTCVTITGLSESSTDSDMEI